MPERLQELVGYSIYNGLIGHIDKKSPANVLLGPRLTEDQHRRDKGSMVWDAAG